MKNKILLEIQKLEKNLCDTSDRIGKNPELGNQEFLAVDALTSLLDSHGFAIEKNIVNKPTAFRAVYDSNKTGPSIAYLCEYDSLPKIGHGCGHNMIGTMSVGAGIALSKFIGDIGGSIVILGTPAEESDGAKVDMSNKGVFDNIDVAMILHPDDKTYESGASLAMDALQFDFTGKSSHAASCPEEGINALDAVLLTFNGINALRQHVKSDAKIHGIIKEGGVAPNIIPDKAVAQFYIRAGDKSYLTKLVEKVKNIAEGASLMTGASIKISHHEIAYDDMKTNKALSNCFNENLRFIGINDINTAKSSFGSIDMGNVSNVVPSIHPYISISNTPLTGHTTEFRDATFQSEAHKALLKGASALALTGYDVLTNSNLLSIIKKEFSNSINQKQ